MARVLALSKQSCWILLSLWLPTTVVTFVLPPSPSILCRFQDRSYSNLILHDADPAKWPTAEEEEPASTLPPADVQIEMDTSIDGGGVQTAAMVIGQQGLLIPLSLGMGYVFSISFPIQFDESSLFYGMTAVLPLAGLAIALDGVEEQFPALQDVTKATQRAVLLFMGGTFRPVFSSVAAMGIGLAAGFGEELLFRGVIQTQLDGVFATAGEPTASAAAILLSGLVFGALHAVTPVYALLATLASFYFGLLLVAFDGNLAVPIVAHAVYDFGALVYTHWEIGNMSQAEKMALLQESKQVDEEG